MKSFKRIFKQNILPAIYSTTLVGGTVLAYYSYTTTKNRLEWEEEQENDEFYKDMTRDSNSYYGINWGFRADQLISDKIDAGDIFFIKYDCNECIKLKDIFKCTYLSFVNHEQDYDSIGFAYRDSRGLFIISNIFGETKMTEYQEFLSQPYLKELSMRKIKLARASVDIQKMFYRNVRKHSKLVENEEGGIKQNSEQMALDYIKAIGIISPEFGKYEDFNPQICSYDENSPFFLNKFVSFDSKVIIRSKTNRELRRND